MGPELLFAYRHPRMLVFLDSASGGSLIQHPCVIKEKAEPNNPGQGRDKTSEITVRYYWPEMYNEVCSYVSLL